MKTPVLVSPLNKVVDLKAYLNILGSQVPGPTLGVQGFGSHLDILGSRVLGPTFPECR